MSKLAVDVVLLPPEEVMDKAIELNKQLPEALDAGWNLNKENCLPHITVAMGVIQEDAIPKVEKILNEIAKNFKPLSLTIPKVEHYESKNEVVSGLKVERTYELTQLHREVVEKIHKPLFTFDATVDMFYQPPKMQELGNYWKSRSPEKNILEKYDPHITLGKGRVDIDKPFKFIASKLALCHLGKRSTCRNVLYSVDLAG